MEEQEKQKIDLAIAWLDKEFGKGSVIRLGNENVEPWPAISTGALTLDMTLGIGGLPRGRVVEIYGPESSGKSTLALSVVAEAQKMGLTAAYIDAEHALDPVYMRALGVDLDNLLLSQPDYGEMALDVLIKLINTGSVGVVVVDSVAALTPKAELEGDMSDMQMGAQARMMGKAIRKLVALASENQTLVIFINQIREKIGVMFGNPETTPGGRALKYSASVRLDVRREASKDTKDKDGNLTGIHVVAKTVKNKMSPPLKRAEFDIIYGKGIDTLGCIVDLAYDKGILEKSGAWYSLDGTNIGQGRQNTIEYFAQDLDLAYKIRDMVLDKNE